MRFKQLSTVRLPESIRSAVRNFHRTIQSVGATGGVYSAFSIYRGKCPGEEIAIYRNIAIYNLIVKYSTVFRKVIENKFKELKTVQYIHNVVSV